MRCMPLKRLAPSYHVPSHAGRSGPGVGSFANRVYRFWGMLGRSRTGAVQCVGNSTAERRNVLTRNPPENHQKPTRNPEVVHAQRRKPACHAFFCMRVSESYVCLHVLPCRLSGCCLISYLPTASGPGSRGPCPSKMHLLGPSSWGSTLSGSSPPSLR